MGVTMGGIQGWEPGMGVDSQASRREEDLRVKKKEKEKKSSDQEPITTTTGDSLVFFLDFS